MLSRDRIARLAALSIFLSAAEMFLPRFLPFFRIGLANIPLLMALDLDLPSFMVLSLLKGIGTSYTSGSLFSVFALMSLLQSLAAGFAMHAAKRIAGSHISIYGISLAGAIASNAVQIAIAVLYTGRGALAFLPAMLIISLPAALATAAISQRIPDPDDIQIPQGCSKGAHSMLTIILLVAAGSAMMMTGLPLIALSLLAAFILQRLSGRRILLLPHLTMLIFMVISSLLTPHGRVIASIFSLPITEGALLDGICRSLRLSGGIALSQAFSGYIRPGNGLIGKTVAMFTMLLSSFRSSEGSIWRRFTDAIRYAEPLEMEKSPVDVPIFTLSAFSIIIIAAAIADCVFF